MQVCISIAVSLAVKQVKVRSDNNNLCMCTAAQKYAKTAVDKLLKKTTKKLIQNCNR